MLKNEQPGSIAPFEVSVSQSNTPMAKSVLESFVTGLQSTNDLDDLRAVFEVKARELGLKYFTYHIVKIAGFGTNLNYVITTYPDEWVQHYIHQGYTKLDPVVQHGQGMMLPFEWEQVAAPEMLEGKQVTLYKEAADLSIQKGLSIPIHGHKGEFAMMSVVPDAKGREAEKLIEEHRDLLHLLSLYYHNQAGGMLIERMLGATKRKSVLTNREREVLQWTAVGKSTWDISQILHLSEASVVFHIENAKRKLGVTNRTHAVVKAMMVGLISLD